MTHTNIEAVSELLPCPFCGEAAEMEHDETSDYAAFHTWNVACSRCDARGPQHQGKNEAVDTWNRRSEVPHFDRARCATEGCGKVATEYFERGGVGSYHCGDCTAKINALSRRSASNTGGVEVKALAAGQRAAMESNGCGLTYMGLRHFCDHPHLPDEMREKTCACKVDAKAAIEAYLSSLAAEAEPVARPSYDAISTMVHACRERQKAAGEGDQMLSRWISEGLDGLYTRSSSVSAEVTVTDEPKHVPHEVALAGFYEAQKPEVKAKPLYDQCCAIYQAMRAASINGGRENG